MTTRRWMIAVAVVAITLGGVREAIRLRRARNELLAKAADYLEAETYFRSLLSSSEKSVLQNKLELRDSTPTPESLSSVQLIGDHPLEFPGRDFAPADEDADARFAEARARSDAMAAKARSLSANRLERQVEYWRRQADYHAAVGRKYRAAAARPWRSVEPDPPRPN